MMETPTHDDEGRPLFSDKEFDQYHMLESEEFEALPEPIKEQYGWTSRWHFNQRMSTPLNPNSIATSSGMNYEETLELWRKAQTQTPDVSTDEKRGNEGEAKR